MVEHCYLKLGPSKIFKILEDSQDVENKIHIETVGRTQNVL